MRKMRFAPVESFRGLTAAASLKRSEDPADGGNGLGGFADREGGVMDAPKRRKSMNDSLRHKIFERDGHKCQICGALTRFFNSGYDTPFGNLPRAGSVDHIHPVSKGGTNDESNLRWVCRSCNCSRGAR